MEQQVVVLNHILYPTSERNTMIFKQSHDFYCSNKFAIKHLSVNPNLNVASTLYLILILSALLSIMNGSLFNIVVVYT